jgi:hypothetical protein
MLNFGEAQYAEVPLIAQPVEKPLYAPSEHPSKTQKPRHCSVMALISKCLDAVLDYRLVLLRLFQQARPFPVNKLFGRCRIEKFIENSSEHIIVVLLRKRLATIEKEDSNESTGATDSGDDGARSDAAERGGSGRSY